MNEIIKAFDFVDHNILLEKLFHYGVRGTHLVSYCLHNRLQCTKIVVDTKSLFLNAICGITQGSIVGSLLFLIN